LTGPPGAQAAGYWLLTPVAAPPRVWFAVGFADEIFDPNPDLPVSKNEFRFEKAGEGTRATYTGTYATKKALEQVLAMGVIEGATSAINQIDSFLDA
jgi:hypothetical protein